MTPRLVSSGGLVVGSALGLAGTFVSSASVRGFVNLVATLLGWAWERFRAEP